MAGINKGKKIDIVVLDMPLLNTMKYKDLNGIESLISDLILQLLSYMAEDERKRIKERQEEGIRVAIQNGVKFGRKKFEIDEEVKSVYHDWKQNKITAVLYTFDNFAITRHVQVIEKENKLHST